MKKFYLNFRAHYALTIFFVLAFLSPILSFGQTTITYTTSGSWTCPQGVTSVQVEAIGGGAGGRSSANTNGHVTGGGGGGAYSKRNSITVNPGTTYSFTVGAGGASDTAGLNTTATINGVTIIARGGSLGQTSGTLFRTGGAGGTFNALTDGDSGYNGGNGGSGYGLGSGTNRGSGGGGGGAAGSTGPGNNGTDASNTTTPGTGGTSKANYGGAGGNGGNNSSGSNASTASGNYGGGGGGAGHKNNSGGSGTGGAMIFTFTCPTNTTYAGSDQNLMACSTTATLNATPVSYGTGTWSVISGTATITSPNSPTSGLTGIIPGTPVTLRWTITNGNCGTTTDDVIISSPIGIGCQTYCSSSGSTYPAGITGVTFNTINNTGTSVNSSYTDYTSLNTTVIKGSTYNLNTYITTGGNYTFYQTAWFDWNGDGDFTDSGESYKLGNVRNVTNTLSSLCTYPILIPYHAATGSIRMRIQSKYNSTSTSCETGFDGEVEDYTIIITNNAIACSTPSSQPSALVLNADGTNISGSFTAASPSPTNYLVVMNTSGIAPTPSNGTTYQIGTTIGAGNIVVDNDTNTNFSAYGLTTSTTYHFFIFSANSICTGGTQYNLVAPLTGSKSTTTNNYCTPNSLRSDFYINKIQSIGTLSDASNLSNYSSNGYANYSSTIIASQIPNGGININIGLTGNQFVIAYVDWNNDKDFVDSGETVYTTGSTATGDTSFGFVVPPSQAVGTYRMRITTLAYGEGSNISSCASNNTTGETEDYSITIVADCAQHITSTTNGSACGPSNTVNISAVSAGATGFRWYTSQTGGSPIATTATGSWTTPTISNTTTYYVTAYNGTCESKYRTEVKAIILPTTNVVITPSTPLVCGEDNILSIIANGDTIEEEIFNEDFEDGINSFAVTTPTNTNGGADASWSIKTSTYQPSGTTVWKPAVNSGAVGSTNNKFAFTTSDYTNSSIVTIMTSPSINTSVYSSLTLNFDHYYSYYGGDSGTIEASTDGGSTWSSAVATYNSDLGSASSFTEATVDMSPFAGQPNVQFRIVYTGTWDDGWAIDNIVLKGVKTLNTTFTWSGSSVDAYVDASCTTPYTNQLVNTIYVKPTLAQLEQSSWSFNATTTLGNGCPITKVINVTNDTKIWKGTVNNQWNEPNNWQPAVVPDINTCVIIPDNTIITGSGYTAYGKNLTVKSTGNLELQANNNLIINDWIDIKTGGNFNIRNNANLVQINDTPSQANSGTLKMDRTATGLHAFDYIYWSSPVEGFHIYNVSPLSLTTRIYHWIPDYANPSGYGYGNWFNVNENMIAGKGYIIRVPNANPTFSTTFTGKPFNGIITKTIARGPFTGTPYTGTNGVVITNEDDNLNLIGNPYPSAIDAIEFLTANSGTIAGQVSLWTHSTPLSNSTSSPYYGSFGYNYKSSDLVTYNSSGNNIGPTQGFNGKIAAGQGFFVKMIDGAAGSGTVTFNNGMRSDASNNAYNNGQFYKTSEKAKTESEKHRIWIDLLDSNLNTSRFMIGYIEGATNSKDNLYDATTNYKESLKAFSIIDEEAFVIQGRTLPFNKSDKVNFGYQAPTNGTYKISISEVDGLFKTTDQKIYLEDLLTNTTHDLTVSPYTFTTNKGIYKNRFTIKFDNQTLSNNDNEYSNSVIVFGKDQLSIKSELFNIKNVTIYDVLGKTLLNAKDITNKEYTAVTLKNSNTAILVKITLENGAIVTKKILF
jgi:hypothetical protein